jgi:hypothetical protein
MVKVGARPKVEATLSSRPPLVVAINIFILSSPEM